MKGRRGQTEVEVTSRGQTTLAIGAIALIVSGCGVYVHDQAVQDQTAKAQETFKGMDLPSAFNALLSAESALSDTELRSIAANETAVREEEIAGLVADETRSGKPATSRIRKRIVAQMTALGGV